MLTRLLSFSLLFISCAVSAQEYTKIPRDLRLVKSEKVLLYKALSDTSNTPAFENNNKTPSYYYVVGTTVSPNWVAVEYKNKVYFTKRTNVPSFEEGLAKVMAESRKKDDKLAALDAKNGFRTYHFGDDISSIPNLKEIEKDGNTKFYTKTDDNLKIGDASLKDIAYGFYKGKLYVVMINTKGLIDSRKVYDAISSQYGNGYQSNKYLEKYYWFGDKVTASYDENSLTHDALISFSSKEINDQKALDKKQAAQKAGADL